LYIPHQWAVTGTLSVFSPFRAFNNNSFEVI
jgi:hypothetical protein